MKILDLTPGKRGIWFDKDNSLVSWGDGEGPFDLVVFDPPHVNVGAGSNMASDYGHCTSEQIREFVQEGGYRAYIRSKPDALMAFKWNDHDQKLERILALIEEWWEPLFGQRTSTRTKHACSTCWVMLKRK